MVIQNKQRRRESKTNEYPTSNSLSKSNDNQNPTTNPTLSRLQSDQGFLSPANQPYPCFPLPAEETETEQACKSHGAGPRPARVVTLSSSSHAALVFSLKSLALTCPE